jgi:hypothetical protein
MKPLYIGDLRLVFSWKMIGHMIRVDNSLSNFKNFMICKHLNKSINKYTLFIANFSGKEFNE